MPKVSDKSQTIYKNGSMGLQQIGEQNNKTVISVSAASVPISDYNLQDNNDFETDQDLQSAQLHSGSKPVPNLVARTLSSRSSMIATVNYNAQGGHQGTGIGKPGHEKTGKKLGHRRVGDDGFVTYKRFETSQLIGSIQLGLEYVFTNEANFPDRDLLYTDFMSIETVPFTKDGLLEKTPAHNYSEFRFRIYASHAFRVFRRLFEIDKDFFVSSLCSEPMVELSAAGASGSIFYVTRDDNFICKTVQHKEAEFLQKILPGYYMNLKQNPRTLLPKFFGLYCYSCNAKNVRIIVMNNLLPSGLKMHHKFDLKGSTYKRKASKRERAKSSPTFKDLDFMEMYPDGIYLSDSIYQSLENSIQRDCRVLETFKIMDYSLLIGIHNVDHASREDLASNNLTSNLTGGGISDGESSSTGTGGGGLGFHTNLLERQGSIQGRERMIAHSTALESITAEVDSMSIGNTPCNTTGNAGNVISQGMPYLQDDNEGHEDHDYSHDDDATDSGINNVWGAIPAKNRKGENLLLFIGIIDILQSYRMSKKLEHFWKSLVHDGDTISVHRPHFYAKRFQSFLFDRVFKRMPPPLENRRGTSFKRGSHLRRTLSNEQDQDPVDTGEGGIGATPDLETQVSVPPPSGGVSQPTVPTVTVIRIGDGTNEVNLPYVLQDRGRAPTSGNWALTRQQSSNSQLLPKEINSVITVNAEVSNSTTEQTQLETSQTKTRNVERPFVKGEVTAEDKQETGSVITMTSDERVQIFVPSPQGTPYNTITKGQNSANSTAAIGSANLAPLFVPNRIPNSESYRSLTPLNMSANSPAHDAGTNSETTNNANVQKVLQETSLEMIKISLVSSEASDNSNNSAEIQNLQGVCPSQDSHNLQGGESLSETLSTLAPATDKTIANDIESLPVDQPQPVSLSQIELEEI